MASNDYVYIVIVVVFYSTFMCVCMYEQVYGCTSYCNACMCPLAGKNGSAVDCIEVINK